MTNTQLPDRGIIFWPVGTGDSTTIVIDDRHVIQVDLHDMAMADDDEAVVAAVIERLVQVLPVVKGRPYLSAFVLTHADKDHCLGFADLLTKVTVGELWATPRLWREFTEGDQELCPDAKAFHEEAVRRVEAILDAVAADKAPESGDRIRVVGYDTDSSEHAYSQLPDEYLSYPGQAVTVVDGEDLAAMFEAFIHAPFKDDCAAARNETSLALQMTLRDAGGAEGHVLLLGDLAYPTITKIFDYSESHNRPKRLAWDVMLAAHHGSKRVMYAVEDGVDVLKQDIMDAFERHAGDDPVVVVSSCELPAKNDKGDNPPHLVAVARYEEIADVVCTGEYPNEAAPRPAVFVIGASGFELVAVEDNGTVDLNAAGALIKGAAVVAGVTVLAGLARTIITRRGARRLGRSPQQGFGQISAAVATARGDAAAPQQPVGFGQA